MRFLLFLFAAGLHVAAVAQPIAPANLHNENLRTWLKANWYDTFFTDLGYSEARIQMYGFIDEANGQIECVYSGFQQPAGFVTFPNPINAEHLVPQSFFGSVSPMRSDIYNLRPTHGSVNSARSNFPYAEVPDANAIWYGVDATGAYTTLTSIPQNLNDFSEREGSVFEPREEYKGDIARQLFYFYTMYPTEAGTFTQVGDPVVFYQWHLNDPVSAEELQRNNRIAQAQGNRNPYVDYPEWVFDAWFWVAIAGCTDPAAQNFDANANTDDGSCVFGPVSGCTYATALNYNVLATIDDGSCTFTVYVSGCTYPNALNYNAAANLDDQSCVFECVSSCPSDVNLDGLINTMDVLEVLSSFGENCPQ